MNPGCFKNAREENITEPAGSHFALLQIDTLYYQQKELGDKNKSMIHVLHILRLVTQHVSGQSNVEAHSPFHCSVILD